MARFRLIPITPCTGESWSLVHTVETRICTLSCQGTMDRRTFPGVHHLPKRWTCFSITRSITPRTRYTSCKRERSNHQHQRLRWPVRVPRRTMAPHLGSHSSSCLLLLPLSPAMWRPPVASSCLAIIRNLARHPHNDMYIRIIIRM